MDIKKLQRLIVDALEDVKAQDIQVFDTTGLTDLFDRVVVASGTSNRQTRALAASVRDKVKTNGGTLVSMEGEDTGEWVLVDLGDAVVHIMQPAIRAYYNLEELWGGKPAKLAAARKTAAKAGAPAIKRTTRATAVPTGVSTEPGTAPSTRKPPARGATDTATKLAAKPAAKRTTKPAAKTANSPAVKPAVKRSPRSPKSP